MTGLWLGKCGWGTNTHLLLASAIGALLCLGSHRRWLWLGLLVLGLSVGIGRAQSVLADYSQITARYGQDVTVTGRVADDPALLDGYQTEFHLDQLSFLDGRTQRTIRGRLKVRGFIFDKLNRYDRVTVSGSIRPSLGNRQGQIYYAQININSRFTHPVETLRRRFLAALRTAIPEPESSLGLGFLVGLRTLLPDSLQHQLSATGLTHIVAVSGFNLTIMIRFARRWFSRYSKYLATVCSFSLIAVFMLATGLSPSIFRAAIVAGLAIWAWYYGRSVKAAVLILLPAAVTAYINPSYIWSDIGWYLSFLAFFGVLVLAPTFMALLKRGKPLGSIAQIFIETLAAQIMTVPLIIWVFDELSLVAPLANLLVLPLVPLAMLLAFLAGLGGMIAPALAGWLGWPAKTVLSFMTDTIAYFGNLNFAQIKLAYGFWTMLWIYTVIITVVVLLQRKLKTHIDKSYSILD